MNIKKNKIYGLVFSIIEHSQLVGKYNEIKLEISDIDIDNTNWIKYKEANDFYNFYNEQKNKELNELLELIDELL